MEGQTNAVALPRSNARNSRVVGTTDLRRQMEELEDRVAMSERKQVAALMEADKLAEFATKNCELRIDAIEQRQSRLERRIDDIVQNSQQKLTSTRELEERLLALEERARSPTSISHKEDRYATELSAVTADLAKRTANLENSLAGECVDSRDERMRDAMLAVQELEALVHSEIRYVHKTCNAMQHNIEDTIVLPLRQFEKRLEEQDQVVKGLLSGSKESLARVEEHEFRLGVLRTKLDVHGEKLSVLDRSAMRRPNEGLSRGTSLRSFPGLSEDGETSAERL
eukprot:TRINITY_DN45966_c0_g1_i1.p1 TRINITY_DN45966_c0_g1~~TRINITY_DN45966_c0_g1_i1.p1  ORF type:complete len:283 (-),score=52.10 TRINITY_DN45966_c0_g1_i1:76-924(-)